MDGSNLALLIPISAVILGITTGIVALVTEHQRKSRALDHRHQERLAAIEKGIELPPDPPRLYRPPSSGRYLLHGMVWLGVGVAIVLALPGLIGDVAQAGWIPAAVGAAHLIFYVVETRRKPQQPRDASSEPHSPDRF